MIPFSVLLVGGMTILYWLVFFIVWKKFGSQRAVPFKRVTLVVAAIIGFCIFIVMTLVLFIVALGNM